MVHNRPRAKGPPLRCASCDNNLDATCFTNSQRRKPAALRKCNLCARAASGQPPPSTAAPASPRRATARRRLGKKARDNAKARRCCTICLDTEGTIVQRECCCRGDSGWVHIGCLIQLANVSADLHDKEDGCVPIASPPTARLSRRGVNASRPAPCRYAAARGGNQLPLLLMQHARARRFCGCWLCRQCDEWWKCQTCNCQFNGPPLYVRPLVFLFAKRTAVVLSVP